MLKTRYRFAVITNVADDLFAGTAEVLDIDFDAAATAEQARGYKSNLHNFNLASERMAVEKAAWLHVADSLFHDIGPASRLGIKCVWVDRDGRGGGTRRADAVPGIVVSDLAELARYTGLGAGPWYHPAGRRRAVTGVHKCLIPHTMAKEHTKSRHACVPSQSCSFVDQVSEFAVR